MMGMQVTRGPRLWSATVQGSPPSVKWRSFRHQDYVRLAAACFPEAEYCRAANCCLARRLPRMYR